MDEEELNIERKKIFLGIWTAVATIVITPFLSMLVLNYQLGRQNTLLLEQKRRDDKVTSLRELIKSAESFRVNVTRYEEARTDIEILSCAELLERKFGDDEAAKQLHSLAEQIEQTSLSLVGEHKQSLTSLAAAIQVARMYFPESVVDELNDQTRKVSAKIDLVISEKEIKDELGKCKDAKEVSAKEEVLRRSYPARYSTQGYAFDVSVLLKKLCTQAYE